MSLFRDNVYLYMELCLVLVMINNLLTISDLAEREKFIGNFYDEYDGDNKQLRGLQGFTAKGEHKKSFIYSVGLRLGGIDACVERSTFFDDIVSNGSYANFTGSHPAIDSYDIEARIQSVLTAIETRKQKLTTDAQSMLDFSHSILFHNPSFEGVSKCRIVGFCLDAIVPYDKSCLGDYVDSTVLSRIDQNCENGLDSISDCMGGVATRYSEVHTRR